MAGEDLALAEATDPWGTLTASSGASRNRPQGQCMFLTLAEHTLGRHVDNPIFMFDSQSISSRHCRIFLKSITMEDGQSGMGVFIKDSSSNGTFVNNQRLWKDTPDFRLRDGDVISLAAPPEFETGFAYVFRDTSAGLKRKPEELRKSEYGKRLRASTVDLPPNLADLRRSNQELRHKWELECNKRYGLNVDLRAAKAMVKMVYNQMLAELQADQASALEESSANLVQQETIIEDLHNRLKAAAQSRIEAEQALNNLKADREAIEKKLEDERSQWNQERHEAESRHEAAVEKIRAEENEESTRQSQSFSRQQKQLEDQLTALQHERDAANTKIVSLQLDKEKLSNELKLRLILLSSDIARLQQKQQQRLMQIYDADPAAGHFDDGQERDDEMPDAEATVRRLSIGTQVATQEGTLLSIDMNEMASTSIAAREDTLPAHLTATQLQLDATQAEPPDRKDDSAVMETQILPEEQRLETALDRNGRDHRGDLERAVSARRI